MKNATIIVMPINQIIQILVPIVLLSCAPPSTQPDSIVNPTNSASTYSFLALGDSYTIGESVSENERLPVQLANRLRKDSVSIADPDIIARTGWTAAELQDAIKANSNQKIYSLVSLQIGVNNQYRGQGEDRYRTEFRELLQTAVKFTGGKPMHVVVLSIPDWGVSPFAAGRDRASITREIDAFNGVAQDECRKSGVAYVDITPLTRSAAGNPTQFAFDGLHYSGKHMQQWAEKALPVVKELLKK